MKKMKLTFSLLAVIGLIFAAISSHAAATSTSLDLARQLNQAFIEVAERASPSVVVINVTFTSSVPALEEDGGSPLEMIPREFRRYFRRQFGEQRPEKVFGQGSGIIIRKDGYILTNRHVIEDADKIEVRLKDGRRFRAEVRGQDAQSDVAVIKIDAKDLPVAALGDSDSARVGEFAIAIGAPFNLDYSVTVGHVSAKGRGNVIHDPSMDQEFIQTDANINLGNSGGPLVNLNGEVIGINTLIRGMSTGIGFAIPVNLAREVADKLIADGKLTRAWLGIGIASLQDDPEFREIVPGAIDGVIVRSILPEGPAAKSDLRPTDVITAIDGKPVHTAQQLKNEIRNKKIGQPVSLDVFRRGKTIKIAIEPGKMRDETTETEERKPILIKQDETTGLGITVQILTHELADRFGMEMTPGVIVTAVEKDSMADRKGIKPGDLITEINQHPVTNPMGFRAALKDSDPKKGVIINFISGKTSRFEILKGGDE